MMQWQPIETAPRDGTTVWLYCPSVTIPQRKGRFHKTHPRMMAGRWVDRPTEGPAIKLSDQALTLLEKHGGFWGGNSFRPISGLPSHWMPLPAPPVTTG